jgi:hypothetical protein
MADEARRRELSRAVEAALDEMQGAERYRLAQREVRKGNSGNGESGNGERPHPLEYDENGFPAPQRLASFGERIRRLISGR